MAAHHQHVAGRRTISTRSNVMSSFFIRGSAAARDEARSQRVVERGQPLPRRGARRRPSAAQAASASVRQSRSPRPQRPVPNCQAGAHPLQLLGWVKMPSGSIPKSSADHGGKLRDQPPARTWNSTASPSAAAVQQAWTVETVTSHPRNVANEPCSGTCAPRRWSRTGPGARRPTAAASARTSRRGRRRRASGRAVGRRGRTRPADPPTGRRRTPPWRRRRRRSAGPAVRGSPASKPAPSSHSPREPWPSAGGR